MWGWEERGEQGTQGGYAGTKAEKSGVRGGDRQVAQGRDKTVFSERGEPRAARRGGGGGCMNGTAVGQREVKECDMASKLL